MSRVTESTIILLFSILLQNCAPPGEDEGTTFTDSAGVVLATAEVPAWGEGEGWRVSEEPILEIGVRDGPSDFIFSMMSSKLCAMSGAMPCQRESDTNRVQSRAVSR